MIISGILLKLTPERAPRTVLRDERPENLGFYACLVTTNVGSFDFVIEKLFVSWFALNSIYLNIYMRKGLCTFLCSFAKRSFKVFISRRF
jgi:hypothetical protein